MKIIVVSDTHGSYRNFKKVMQLHRNADIVVHCGDSRDEVDHMAAKEKGADIALYGHTHVAHDEEVDGIRLFNPGSLGYEKSFGVIEIRDGQVLSNIARLP